MRRIVRIGFVLLVALGAARLHAAETPAWRAGVATVDITPEGPMWLGGYAARTRPSSGVATPLRAKALAVADAQGGRFVFVTFDAIGIPRDLRLEVARRLQAQGGVKPEEFVLGASHTHSAPEFRRGRVPASDPRGVEAARAYLGMLEEKLTAVALQALAGLAPARVTYVRARAGFAMNRRLPRGDNFTNAPNPEGPVDHDVPVLKVEGADGKLRAVMFGYACHNTTLTQVNYEICADYAGFAQRDFEQDHPGTTALFLTGCAGDQNPYPRGTLALAQAHGRTLATAIDAALGTTGVRLAGRVRAAYGEIPLRYAEVPSRAEYQARIGGRDRLTSEHAQRMMARIDAEQTLPATYPYPVQVLRLGDGLTVVALGGEVVVDYSLRLKRELGGSAKTWVAAYANDVLGYIPNERVLRERGYEGEEASRLGSLHPSPWAPGLEEQIVGEVHALLGGLR